MKQDAHNKYWSIVASELKALQPTTHFSKKACEKRFRALAGLSDTVPFEFDDNTLLRAEALEQYRNRLEIRQAKEEANRAAPEADKRAPPKVQNEEYIVFKGKKIVLAPQVSYSDNILSECPSAAIPNSRPSQKRRPPVDLECDTSDESEIDKRNGSNANKVKSLLPKSRPSRNRSGASSTPKPTAAPSSRAQAGTSANSTGTNPQAPKDLYKISCEEVRQELSSRGFSPYGIKDVIVTRLRGARNGETGLPRYKPHKPHKKQKLRVTSEAPIKMTELGHRAEHIEGESPSGDVDQPVVGADDGVTTGAKE